MILTSLVNLALPLLLLGLLTFVPLRGFIPLVLQALSILAVIATLAVVSIWAAWPYWLPYIYLVACVGLTAWRIATRSKQNEARPTRASWIGAAVYTLVGLWAASMLAPALSGRSPDREVATVQLAWPLAEGRYVIAHGGSREAINPHMKTLDTAVPRFAEWRGQSYAVDILGYDPRFWRQFGRGSDPADYPIWESTILSPCDGTVKVIEAGAPDMAVPQMDRSRMVGNAVLIDCGSFDVVLAHLRQGSIAVELGQQVSVGTRIGLVGNSGNSSEPHLHLHAQRSGEPGAPFGGTPLQIEFTNEFPYRNRLFVGR